MFKFTININMKPISTLVANQNSGSFPGPCEIMNPGLYSQKHFSRGNAVFFHISSAVKRVSSEAPLR